MLSGCLAPSPDTLPSHTIITVWLKSNTASPPFGPPFRLEIVTFSSHQTAYRIEDKSYLQVLSLASSRAKGGKPKHQSVRALASVAKACKSCNSVQWRNCKMTFRKLPSSKMAFCLKDDPASCIMHVDLRNVLSRHGIDMGF